MKLLALRRESTFDYVDDLISETRGMARLIFPIVVRLASPCKTEQAQSIEPRFMGRSTVVVASTTVPRRFPWTTLAGENKNMQKHKTKKHGGGKTPVGIYFEYLYIASSRVPQKLPLHRFASSYSIKPSQAICRYHSKPSPVAILSTIVCNPYPLSLAIERIVVVPPLGGYGLSPECFFR